MSGGVIPSVTSCVVPNTGLPMSVEYAQRHLKALTDTEYDLVEGWIRAAGQIFEEQTGRPLLTATFEYWLDGFPSQGLIELPRAPLVAVESIKYVTSDGDLIPFEDGASPSGDGWVARTPAGVYAPLGWVMPAPGLIWPTGQFQEGGVRIRFTAGYGTTEADVPASVKATLLLLVGMFDQFRSQLHFSEGAKLETLPFGVDQLLFAFKYTCLPTTVPRWS